MSEEGCIFMTNYSTISTFWILRLEDIPADLHESLTGSEIL